MIKVLVCCAGGFSSSFITLKMQHDIIEKGYEDKISVQFSSFSEIKNKLSDYDVIMVCPHLRYKLPEFIEKYGNITPIYVIPALMYGLMNIDDIYEDACDIIEGYNNSKMNPFYFPNENNKTIMKRNKSYRKTIFNYWRIL